jgi:hypothetical protein
MLRIGYRQILQLAAGAVAAMVMFASAAVAQTNTNQAINQFLANPAQVLQQYPNGGAQLISLIRDVAVSHPEALQTITGLLSGATTDQQSAIGSGLGQAAQIVVRTNQAYANQIQQAIAGSTSEDAKVSFAGVTGNTTIAAAGGGGGGGGGGAGGGTGGPTGSTGFAFGGASGGAQSFGGLHYQTSAQNYFTGSGASGASNSTSTRSVSPH